MYWDILYKLHVIVYVHVYVYMNHGFRWTMINPTTKYFLAIFSTLKIKSPMFVINSVTLKFIRLSKSFLTFSSKIVNLNYSYYLIICATLSYIWSYLLYFVHYLFHMFLCLLFLYTLSILHFHSIFLYSLFILCVQFFYREVPGSTIFSTESFTFSL